MAGPNCKKMQFCSICYQSHDQGKGHVYSKRHKERLQKLLDKFGKKVEECLKYLDDPSVSIITEIDRNEHSKQFWCHFCNSNECYHQVQEQVILYCAGFIQHFTSTSHIKNMVQFWHLHRLDLDLQTKFRLKEDSVEMFWKKVADVKERYLKDKSNKLLMESSKIAVVDQMRADVVNGSMSEDSLSVSTNSMTTNVLPLYSRVVSGPRMVPPWLMDDKGETPVNSRPIGPTMQDWQRHLESVRKKKLPAQRVGANFDRQSSVPSTWLPSFGRVWNHGRRLQSRREFNSETNTHRKKRKLK